MRIRIVIDLNNISLSVDYRSALTGLLYNMLPINSDTIELHDKGKLIDKKIYKLFTFSEIYGLSSFDKDTKKITFKGNACFDITFFDENIMLEIINYLDSNNTVLLQNRIINIVKYDILNDTPTKENIKTYYTVSPITVYRTEKSHQIYYNPLDLEFKELIISNLSRKFYLCYNKNLPNVEVIDIKNVRKKIIKFRNIIYEAYHLRITFKNLTKEVQNVIMTCGLGPKNSIGFGMVSCKDEKKDIFI